MLSFFAKKKQNTDASPEEVIQGPSDKDNSAAGNDFIFVDKRVSDEDPNKFRQHMGIYPPMPRAFGMSGNHGQPIYPPGGLSAGSSGSVSPVPYVQGVPFELASQLCTKNQFEVTQLQVDSILALLTRQISIDEQQEYNFTLERSVLNECC